MDNHFFERPILNSPYEYPSRHWELDQGQPTQNIVEHRRKAEFITPIPKPKKRKNAESGELFDESMGLSSTGQKYDPISIINQLRSQVDEWRKLKNPNDWLVTPETARLLQHWRHHEFNGVRPFFCQIEAVETIIWLTEVAPKLGKKASQFLDYMAAANNDANPELMRLALKLATGAGKTTVMAMIIAWQTLNAVRQPNSKKFTRGFLLVAPGITIRDRLRVLRPNDPDSYYQSREIVPSDMLGDLDRAKIVITNYHAFKLRERIELSKGGRLLLQGRTGDELDTLETEGQMLQRVMPELMGMKNIMVINDEAHHCYREKPHEDDDLTGDEKKEVEENNEAARLWITGIEAVNRKLGVERVVDLSATPFFLRGSGYAEGMVSSQPSATTLESPASLACARSAEAFPTPSPRIAFSSESCRSMVRSCSRRRFNSSLLRTYSSSTAPRKYGNVSLTTSTNADLPVFEAPVMMLTPSAFSGRLRLRPSWL